MLTSTAEEALQSYFAAVVALFNDLAGIRPPARIPDSRQAPGALWRRTWESIWSALVAQITLLLSQPLRADSLDEVVRGLEQATSVNCVPFNSDKIDLLPRAATLDPSGTQAPHLRRVAETPSRSFPGGVGPGAAAIPRVRPGEVREYDRYVARGLAAGKFEPVRNALAGGGVLCIPKSSGDRLRAIWNGADISGRTAPAPMPPGLMTPEALGRMEFPRPPLMSKRDGEVLFDQLSVPRPLVPYLAAPSTTIRRLTKAGASLEVLDALREAGLQRDTRFFPCSKVWPMGFSWASWAAQSHTLALKDTSLLPRSMALAQDKAAPVGDPTACGVATDDIILLSSGTRAEALRDVQSLDDACDLFGMSRKREKDVSLQPEGVAVGLALQDSGRTWGPPPTSTWKVWLHAAALARVATTTPRAVQTAVGTITWLSLIRRLLFCLLFRVYGFTSLPDEDLRRELPSRVKAELLRSALLGAVWTRPTVSSWYSLMAFTDASTTGLGAVAAPLPLHSLQALSRVSFGPSEQVILDRPHERVRARTKGSRSWVMLIPRDSMKIVLQERRSDAAHINVAEGRAVIRWLQRAVRDPAAWRTKLFIVVDSRVAWGAFTKGRSSSWAVTGCCSKP